LSRLFFGRLHYERRQIAQITDFPSKSLKNGLQKLFQIILLTGMPPMRENGDGLVSNLIGPLPDETRRPTFPCK
jgi:hypothetical protein